MEDKTTNLDLGRPSGSRRALGNRLLVWRESPGVVEAATGPDQANSAGFGLVHGGAHPAYLRTATSLAATWCDAPGTTRRRVMLSRSSGCH